MNLDARDTTRTTTQNNALRHNDPNALMASNSYCTFVQERVLLLIRKLVKHYTGISLQVKKKNSKCFHGLMSV